MGTLKFYVYHSYDARFPQLIQLFVTLWTVGRQAPVDGIFRIVHLNSFFFFITSLLSIWTSWVNGFLLYLHIILIMMSIHHSFVWLPAEGGDYAIIYLLLYSQGPRDYLTHLAPWCFLNKFIYSYIILVDFLNIW